MASIEKPCYLAKLAKRFGSDKWGSHWYAQHYQRHFASLRWKRITLLEIGIGGDNDPRAGGASLRMWKHFFPRAQIAGIDIHDKSAHRSPRIRTYQGDQGDADFLKSVIRDVGSPDIIIDDGSHLNEHVLKTFEVLFPLLKPTGIYAVEDTQTSYWPKYGGARSDSVQHDRPSMMEVFKGLTDGLNHSEYLEPNYQATYSDRHVISMHFYHNLVFVYKGVNDEESNCVKAGVLNC
jgi:hypothetical protein